MRIIEDTKIKKTNCIFIISKYNTEMELCSYEMLSWKNNKDKSNNCLCNRIFSVLRGTINKSLNQELY